jgi:hypothetical protein
MMYNRIPNALRSIAIRTGHTDERSTSVLTDES